MVNLFLLAIVRVKYKIDDYLFPAVVTGWGNLASGGSSPDILQEVTVQVLENSNCGNYPQSMITDNMLCAGVEGKDSCQGDSGGPMVTEVGIQNQLGFDFFFY